MQSKRLSEILKGGFPAAIGKIGFSEMKVLHSAISQQPLTQQDLHDIFNNAGVFPPDKDGLFSFIHEILNALDSMDILARMKIDEAKEDQVISSYAKQAQLINLRDLEPYYWDDPWSKYLENKKVLVISPFTETIERQFLIRDKLWKGDILPDMSLECIKCSLSHYISPSKHASWQESLTELKQEMSKKDFDVCLIGAGAWSLPLATHAKSLGKLGIHLGGPLQILFGIKGRRWDEHEVISTFYNESWVRPSSSENVKNSVSIEGGCYW